MMRVYLNFRNGSQEEVKDFYVLLYRILKEDVVEIVCWLEISGESYVKTFRLVEP